MTTESPHTSDRIGLGKHVLPPALVAGVTSLASMVAEQLTDGETVSPGLARAIEALVISVAGFTYQAGCATADEEF